MIITTTDDDRNQYAYLIAEKGSSIIEPALRVELKAHHALCLTVRQLTKPYAEKYGFCKFTEGPDSWSKGGRSIKDDDIHAPDESKRHSNG